MQGGGCPPAASDAALLVFPTGCCPRFPSLRKKQGLRRVQLQLPGSVRQRSAAQAVVEVASVPSVTLRAHQLTQSRAKRRARAIDRDWQEEGQQSHNAY